MRSLEYRIGALDRYLSKVHSKKAEFSASPRSPTSPIYVKSTASGPKHTSDSNKSAVDLPTHHNRSGHFGQAFKPYVSGFPGVSRVAAVREEEGGKQRGGLRRRICSHVR
eukprot:910272-Amorphochlora_amoeboformis.AAC.1